MKPTLQKPSPKRVIALLGVALCGCHAANAAISISSFNLTATQVSFEINGVLPDNAPNFNAQFIHFTHPVLSTSPGFALGDFLAAESISFTGTQSIQQTVTGLSVFGDYFSIIFTNPLAGGETVSGTFLASWGSTAFNPEQAPALNLFWGSVNGSPQQTIYLTNTAAPIPEPAAIGILLGLAASGYVTTRRRFSRTLTT